jgi:DNA-directed RNA polymerase specialized sigma24 family protein
LAEAFAVDPALLYTCLRWAAARAPALRDPAVDKEDLEQEARIALWQACRTHNPALSSLRTWCSRHVKFAVTAFLVVQCRKRRALQLSLDAPGCEGGTLGEAVACPGKEEDRLADADFVCWLVRELDLTPVEALALRIRFLDGSYREAAAATGIPWKSLDNAWQRVRKKAFDLLEKEGLV